MLIAGEEIYSAVIDIWARSAFADRSDAQSTVLMTRRLHFLRCRRGNVDGIAVLVRLTNTGASKRSGEARSPGGTDARQKGHWRWRG